MRPLAEIAARFAMVERHGMRRKSASNRGATRNRSGPIPIASIASTSSETCIVPNSAVKAAPMRAASMIPVINGPSSRVKAIATSPGTRRSVPKRCNWYPVSKAMVRPRKNETRPTSGTEPTPARWQWRKKLEARNGTRPSRIRSTVSSSV